MRIKSDRTVIAGHSHIFALGASQGYKGPLALEAFEQDGRRCSFLMEEYIGADRSKEYWSRLVELSRKRPVAIVFNGNQHYGIFMFQPDPMIDVHDSEVARNRDVDGTVVVPRALIEAYFNTTLAPLRTLIESLKAAGCPRVTVFGTPAPKRDANAFMPYLKRVGYIDRVAEKTGTPAEDLKMTPEYLMLKLWRMLQGMLASLCAELGVEFLPTPENSRGPDGFLAETCEDYTDLTHGNRHYGEMMLDGYFQKREAS